MITIRERVLEVLRVNPEGIATLPLMQRLGATSTRERQSIAAALVGLAARGLVRSSTAGATPSSVWTLIPDSMRLPTGYRGAAELARARARAAAHRELGPQPTRTQQMAAHESARTTKLYDRRNDKVTLDEVEKITL
jgi:hypothetical protein